MFKNNILDTLVIEDSKIVLRPFHIRRTQEAFQFLNIQADFSVIENCYYTIEKEYAEKLQSGECLRIIFSPNFPLSYTVEVQKIQKLNPIIKLNTVHLKTKSGPEAAYKWENREHWTALLKEKKYEADDILAVSIHYDLIETSRFNVFCYDEVTDSAFTPSLESGCVNGVFRRFALSEGSISLPDLGNKKLIEKNIKLDELSYYQLFVGNSVRGVLKAALI